MEMKLIPSRLSGMMLAPALPATPAGGGEQQRPEQEVSARSHSFCVTGMKFRSRRGRGRPTATLHQASSCHIAT